MSSGNESRRVKKGKQLKKYNISFSISSISDLKELFEWIYKFDSEFRKICRKSEFKIKESIFQKLYNLMTILEFPITVYYESYYVDKVYRDEYYEYYSKKHFNLLRYTKRMVFFEGEHNIEELVSSDEEVHKKIENDLIGMVVIKPTKTFGRILIDPNKIIIPKSYINTTRFKLTIQGYVYTISAFPLSGQDIEVMTCSEVNIWQIIEYFGSKFNNYKTILPSELIKIVKKNSNTRVLPSDGLTANQESSVFMKIGFSPKIYFKRAEYEKDNTYIIEEQYKEPSFNEILHMYVDSGIPVLVNLRGLGVNEHEFHSVTCIGHEFIPSEDITKRYNDFFSEENKNVDNVNCLNYNKLRVLKSWKLISKYIVMEDHSNPYISVRLDKMNIPATGIDWEIFSFVVPLYKHIFMSAEDAYAIVKDMISKTQSSIKESIGNSDEIIIRLFLTSSVEYKNHRIFSVLSSDKISKTEKFFYGQANYPKYLWVCEYFTKESYSNNMAIGEYIIDATSSKGSIAASVISMRHGQYVTYRAPKETDTGVFTKIDVELNKKFTSFTNKNLSLIEGRKIDD